MPKARMKDEDEYALPEDTLLRARLDSVEEKTITFFYKAHHKAVTEGKAKEGDQGEIHKWVWKFTILDGDYAGLGAWGETETYLSSHANNKVRQWAEALRDAPFTVGEGLDTDDLLGLSCVLTVRHDPPRPKRDGGMFYGSPVDSVFPASAMADVPPF